jgi:anti-sigma regulatory factor (Ser/Thr protein kinase)
VTQAALTNEAQAAEAWTSVKLRGGAGVASQARAVVEPLRSKLCDDVAADLTLLLSELVTNSYRHSGAGDQGIGVDVEVAPGRVRAEVSDHGRGFRAEPVPAEERGEGGWGLMILDRLADRWGVRKGPPTSVWFELAR